MSLEGVVEVGSFTTFPCSTVGLHQKYTRLACPQLTEPYFEGNIILGRVATGLVTPRWVPLPMGMRPYKWNHPAKVRKGIQELERRSGLGGQLGNMFFPKLPALNCPFTV